MKKLINYIKIWNYWQKPCMNSFIYKIAVLFGYPSPTFEIAKLCYENDK